MVYLDPDKIDFTTFMPDLDRQKDTSQKPCFRLVGLKVGSSKGLSFAVDWTVRSMQKSLCGKKDWLYFYQGYDIKSNGICVDKHAYDVPEGRFLK